MEERPLAPDPDQLLVPELLEVVRQGGGGNPQFLPDFAGHQALRVRREQQTDDAQPGLGAHGRHHVGVLRHPVIGLDASHTIFLQQSNQPVKGVFVREEFSMRPHRTVIGHVEYHHVALDEPRDAGVERAGQVPMTTVLFACVHNAGRSQMAAALFNLEADPTKARAMSAGTRPGPHVHPEVLAAMRELGVDLAGVQPQRLSDDLARQAQVLITMGCGDECPVVPGTVRDDWPLEDVEGKPLERVREIRDQILARVRDLVERSGWAVSE
jgi:arsenate reductase (thioredoxin)